MSGPGSSGGGGDEPFTGRAAMGYDGEIFYLGLTLAQSYEEGFVEGCLERVGEDDPEGEALLPSEWEEGDRDLVLKVLKGEVEVRVGRPAG